MGVRSPSAVRNLALLVAIVLSVGACSYVGFQEKYAGSPTFVLVVAAPTVLFAAVGLYFAHRDGVLGDLLRVRGGDFSRGFIATAVVFAGAWGFTRFFAPVGSDRESWLARLYLQLGAPSMLRARVGSVVAVFIVTALSEEILWRGLVPSLVEERVGSRRAWMVSAGLYALAHLPVAWALRVGDAGLNPVIPLAALGCGLVWGGMARRFGRLWPGIFSHILFDWAAVMMFRFWGPSL